MNDWLTRTLDSRHTEFSPKRKRSQRIHEYDSHELTERSENPFRKHRHTEVHVVFHWCVSLSVYCSLTQASAPMCAWRSLCMGAVSVSERTHWQKRRRISHFRTFENGEMGYGIRIGRSGSQWCLWRPRTLDVFLFEFSHENRVRCAECQSIYSF